MRSDGRRYGLCWHRAGLDGRAARSLVLGRSSPSVRRRAKQTLLPRPGRPTREPRSFINSNARPGCVAKIVSMNESAAGPALAFPRTLSAIHRIFNDHVLHTYAQTDRQTPAAWPARTIIKTRSRPRAMQSKATERVAARCCQNAIGFTTNITDCCAVESCLTCVRGRIAAVVPLSLQVFLFICAQPTSTVLVFEFDLSLNLLRQHW